MNDNPAVPAMPVRAAIIRPESCKNCKFAFVVPGNQLQCRRFPPNAQLTNNGGRVGTATFFPVVQPNEFCGEFAKGIIHPTGQ